MSSSMAGYAGMRGATDPMNPTAGNRQLRQRYQQFTPESMQLYEQAFGQLKPGSYLSRLAGGDQSLFDEMEAPALRQFSGIQGNIASRFSGMGLGGRHSSGFQNTMSSAASNFAQDLQSRRQSMQMQAIKDLHGMSRDLLGDYQQEPKQSRLQQLLSGVLPLVGAGAGAFFGGPMGMAIGSAAGSALSGGISGRPSQSANWADVARLPTKWGA